MPSNTKNIITDLSGIKPVPQYFNPTADAYEVIQGANGANRVLIYDASGAPLFTTANPAAMMLTGSNVTNSQAIPIKKTARVQLDTLLNAVSLIAGGTTNAAMGGDSSEDEIWALVSIDQQPWTLYTGSVWIPTGQVTDGAFPKRSGETVTGTTVNPRISLLLGSLPPYELTGLTAPTTLQEARQFLTGYTSDNTISITNSSAVTATLTLKILRVWR